MDQWHNELMCHQQLRSMRSDEWYNQVGHGEELRVIQFRRRHANVDRRRIGVRLEQGEGMR